MVPNLKSSANLTVTGCVWNEMKMSGYTNCWTTFICLLAILQLENEWNKAHLHWQKPKSKNLVFCCCTVYTARKTHNILGFWHEKRMREKTRISYWCFGKWCACATSLYLWPYTCSAHYVAGRGRVIPLKVIYHMTKNPINTGEIGASVYIGKKPVKFRRSFKKSRCGGGFFDSGFLERLGEVA